MSKHCLTLNYDFLAEYFKLAQIEKSILITILLFLASFMYCADKNYLGYSM